MFLFPFFPVFVNQFLSIFGQPISGMDSPDLLPTAAANSYN